MVVSVLNFRWEVADMFSLLSSQRNLTHEQRLRLKTEGRSCPEVTLKSQKPYTNRFSGRVAMKQIILFTVLAMLNDGRLEGKFTIFSKIITYSL